MSLSGPSVGKRQVEIREVKDTKYQFLYYPLNGGLGVNLLIQSGTPLFYKTDKKGLAYIPLVETSIFPATRQE